MSTDVMKHRVLSHDCHDCHEDVSVTGVCPQLVVIAPSHSVSQHRPPAEKIALDCDTGPRSTLHMAKRETGDPRLDLESSRVIRAPQICVIINNG